MNDLLDDGLCVGDWCGRDGPLRRDAEEVTMNEPELIQVSPEEAAKIAAGHAKLAQLLKALGAFHTVQRVRAAKKKAKARKADKVAKASRKGNR